MTMTFGGSTGLVFPDSTTQGTGGYTGFRNRIINGAMMIDQRNAGASVSSSANGFYTLDRWDNQNNSSGTRFSVQQNAGSVTPPAGFTNYLGVTSTSAYSVGSSDVLAIRQKIEGYNVADLGWGAAGASSITLSFWVRSSLTGTFGCSFGNNDGNRFYPITYTISSANTWEQKIITIAGDTTGTWNKTNLTGIQVFFNLGTGSTYSSASGAWSSSGYAPTGATSVVGTNGATFYITGVQLEKGSVATPFEVRQYGTELALCQRYYQNVYTNFTTQFMNTGNAQGAIWFFSKRTAPSIALVGSPGYSNGSTNYSDATLNTYYYGSNENADVRLNIPSGGFAGGNAVLVNSNSATAYFTLSSEL